MLLACDLVADFLVGTLCYGFFLVVVLDGCLVVGIVGGYILVIVFRFQFYD